MLEAYGPRTTDVLTEVRDSLRAYVESGERLVEYLADNSQSFAFTPHNVILLISKSYHGGVLHLYDFVPSPCVLGPEDRFLRVKEAESCITLALREVYGIKKKTVSKKSKLDTASPVSLDQFKETEAESTVKQELRWTCSASSIKKELEQLENNFKFVARNKNSFPTLNEYATFASFHRRIRPFIAGLELEVLPHERVVERVEHFLKTLYKKVDHMLVKDTKNKKK